MIVRMTLDDIGVKRFKRFSKSRGHLDPSEKSKEKDPHDSSLSPLREVQAGDFAEWRPRFYLRMS